MQMIDAKDIETFRKLLKQELAEIENPLPGKTSSEGKESFLRQRLRLEGALHRIDNGMFGRCCSCDEKLDRLFLNADPAAPFCDFCEEEIEVSRQAR
ncbi:MAG: hypothetical protein Q8L65_04620 [Burkholderiales bacterium]|jgi:hypothetical protein|nr:hypothetical protein [Burkholderiales bacterium]MDP2397083.1 hypothetical protein [Burkholderiales bacterium]